MQLYDTVTVLKQISGSYSFLLNKLGIYTIKDLLTYFPVKYIDSTKVKTIQEMLSGNDFDEDFLIKIKIRNFKNTFLKSKKTIQQATLYDESGEIKCIWFNQPFLKDVLKEQKEFLMLGKVIVKPKSFQFSSKLYEPVINDRESVHLGRIAPEYSLTEGISKKWFRNRVKNLIDNLPTIEIKDEFGIEKMSESDINDLLSEVHFPSNSDKLEKAIDILSKYELTNIQLKLEEKRQKAIKFTPPELNIQNNTELALNFIKKLPFILTEDQLNVIKDLIDRMSKNILLNDLIQGDVGSGKTILAIIASFIVVKNKYQSVILSPTTILAKQHFKTFTTFLKGYNIGIELVTSDNKNTITKDILIGTSAVLARKENLIKKLGLIVVDEQHRFGVVQREELLKPFSNIINKDNYPHFINMSATPIPRTIAQVFFGDVRVNTIRTKPKGRLSIKTFLVNENKRQDSYKWVINQVNSGDQVYWVCPLVSDSEKVEAQSAETLYKELSITLSGCKVGLIHGQMKEKDKNEAMTRFINHEIDILVSTSVIEVGIDVPNATVIIIENAERFGLAQLHQIRGRVGRGNKQSWCFLFYAKDASNLALERLDFLSKNDNGLKIAEFDLQNRGPGEIYGFKQSGIPNLKIARLNNLEIIKESREISLKLYSKGYRSISIFDY